MTRKEILKYIKKCRDKDMRADLKGINLTGIDLRYADLTGVGLRYANLYKADLRYANLYKADLDGADLTGVDIRYCIGNNREIKTLQLNTYIVVIYRDQIAIGCKQFSIKEWKSFTGKQILDMDGEKALNWWILNRNIVLTLASREL